MDRLEYFRRKYFEKYLENYYESFTTQETMLDYIEKAEKGGLNDYFERAVDIYFSDERYKSHKLYSLANYDTIKEILSLIVFFSKVNFEYD